MGSVCIATAQNALPVSESRPSATNDNPMAMTGSTRGEAWGIQDSTALDQTVDTAQIQVQDSIKKELILETASSILSEEDKVSEEVQYTADEDLIVKLQKIQDKTILLEELKLQIGDGLDTLAMQKVLPTTGRFIDEISSNVQSFSGGMNLRSLEGLNQLVKRAMKSIDQFDDMLREHREDLNRSGALLNEMVADTLLQEMLSGELTNELIEDDIEILRSTLAEVQQSFLVNSLEQSKYQAAVSDIRIRLLVVKNQAAMEQKRMAQSFWSKKINYIWEPRSYEVTGSAWNNVRDSNFLNLQILKQFYRRHTGGIFGLLGIVIGLFLLIRQILKRIPVDSPVRQRVPIIGNRPFFATLTLILPFGLVLFNELSVVFTAVILLFQVLALLPLVKSHFGTAIFRPLLITFPAYLYVVLSALQFVTNYGHRWVYLGLSLYFIFLGVHLYKKADRGEQKDSWDRFRILKFLSIFLIGMAAFSLLGNVLGRYLPAKSFAQVGILNFYLGIAMYFFVQITLEVVFLILESGKKSASMASSLLDYLELKDKIRGLVALFALGIWLFLLLLQFGYWDSTVEQIRDFLTEPRSIGKIIFSFSDILIFAGIIVLSIYLANGIGYLTSLRDQQTNPKGKGKIGSAALLIRLAVLTVGFLLAIVATGIPLDRITIVLGALSVGIGFGLQTIVNNLISGLILVFERPLKIGDRVQVGTLEGVVREIGIRASKITDYDGAEVIIPNGDLLADHLINWTHSNDTRRLELIIGVHYDSDMDLVYRLIQKELDRDIVLKDPPPLVLMQTFNESSVDFRVLFWIPDIENWMMRRDEIMHRIWDAFKENGVKIPYSQLDLHIKDIPDSQLPESP